MKKMILLLVFMFSISWLLQSYVFAQGFWSQRPASIWVVGMRDEIPFHDSGISSNYRRMQYYQTASNWFLALIWLYYTIWFIKSPSWDSLKKIVYVWIMSFISNLAFSFTC